MKSKLFVICAVASLGVAACTPSDAEKSPEPPAEAPGTSAPGSTAAMPAPSTPEEAAASEARVGPIPGTYTETDQPINHPSWSSCLAVNEHLDAAIEQGRAQGDRAALAAAKAAFQAGLKRALPDEGAAEQMMASTLPFFDELTPDQLKASVALCNASRATIAADKA